jgi:hypothetical protein
MYVIIVLMFMLSYEFVQLYWCSLYSKLMREFLYVGSGYEDEFFNLEET